MQAQACSRPRNYSTTGRCHRHHLGPFQLSQEHSPAEAQRAVREIGQKPGEGHLQTLVYLLSAAAYSQTQCHGAYMCRGRQWKPLEAKPHKRHRLSQATTQTMRLPNRLDPQPGLISPDQ